MPSRDTADAPRRTRLPAEQRRRQILDTAAQLFHQRGYGGVGIDDIGREVGISGPAVYRHVAGKEALLSEICIDLIDRLITTSKEQVELRGDDPHLLETVLRESLAVCLDQISAVVVCLRHTWSLGSERAAEVTEHATELASIWVPILKDQCPGDWTSYSIFLRAAGGMMIAAHGPLRGVPADRGIDILCSALLQVLAVPLGPSGVEHSSPPPTWTRASRREQILDVAVGLFRERGYGGVSMADIADAVDLTPSATYRHFASKEELLSTAITRATSRMTAGLDIALQGATSADDALQRIVGAYVQVTCDDRDLVAVALTEWYHLPEEGQRARRNQARQLMAEWVHCMAETRPDLDQREAQLLAISVQGLITEVARSHRAARRPQLNQELVSLALAALRPPPLL